MTTDERNLIALSDDQLEQARRAMLYEINDRLGQVGEQIERLMGIEWPPGVITEDARNSARSLRRLVDAMDALGWPPMETR